MFLELGSNGKVRPGVWYILHSAMAYDCAIDQLNIDDMIGLLHLLIEYTKLTNIRPVTELAMAQLRRFESSQRVLSDFSRLGRLAST